LLIDERAGRQEAETRHLTVAGALLVLLQAALRGHCDFRVEIERLRQFGFRASRPLEAAMLARYEQEKQAR